MYFLLYKFLSEDSINKMGCKTIVRTALYKKAGEGIMHSLARIAALFLYLYIGRNKKIEIKKHYPSKHF
jgi:hypothetical protein